MEKIEESHVLVDANSALQVSVKELDEFEEAGLNYEVINKTVTHELDKQKVKIIAMVHALSYMDSTGKTDPRNLQVLNTLLEKIKENLIINIKRL